MKKKILLLVFELWLIAALIPFAAKAEPAPVLTLTEAINTALANNQSMRQAALAVELATARYRETEGAFQPQLSISETAGRQFADSAETKAYNFDTGKWQKVETNAMLQNNYDTKLALQLPLYTGQRLEALREQAAQNTEQAKANALKARQGLIQDTVTGYYALLQSHNALDVARKAYEQMQSHLKNAMLNYQNGTVAKSDVLRAEVELASAEQNLFKAENNVRLAATTLCNIMGIDLHTNLVLNTQATNSYFLPDLDPLLAAARQNRPELTAMMAQAGAAKAAVTAAKSGKLPALNLNGTYDWKGNSFPPGDASWSLMLNMTWNAFDGGVTASRVSQAENNLGITQSQLRQLNDTIVLEATQAYFNVQDAAKRQDTARKATAKADEDFRIAQLRYRAGIGTSVEVLDAHVAFLNAHNNQIQTQYDYHTSYAKLLKAAGLLDSGERMSSHAQ